MTACALPDIFNRFPDTQACDAVASRHVADVAVAGTVADEPTFFVGKYTRAPHETFDIVTAHGLHLRVVDNVSLAPPVPVHAGDTVVVAGQLIPTSRGAIVHDTHHCPGPGWHRGGFIEWNGKRYA